MIRIPGLQVESDNVSSCRVTTTPNGLPVAQTLTSKKAATTARTTLHIAGTSVCWKSMMKFRVMFLAAAVVIQHRKRKSILLSFLFLWLSALCWYHKYCTTKRLSGRTFMFSNVATTTLLHIIRLYLDFYYRRTLVHVKLGLVGLC